MRKAYSEHRDTVSGFKISSNVTHIAPSNSISNVASNMNSGGAIFSITLTQEDKATAAYNEYVEGLDDSLSDVK